MKGLEIVTAKLLSLETSPDMKRDSLEEKETLTVYQGVQRRPQKKRETLSFNPIN